jgi:hypothetical protein
MALRWRTTSATKFALVIVDPNGKDVVVATAREVSEVPGRHAYGGSVRVEGPNFNESLVKLGALTAVASLRYGVLIGRVLPWS